MTNAPDLIPHLFRTESSKLISVLTHIFGLANMSVAEDIVSDTFLLASETWGLKGVPQNPTAWLYTVAKNKVTDQLRRDALFQQKIYPELKRDTIAGELVEPNLSEESISDSQLRMMFAVCHPAIPEESQIGLSLRILCGFGISEIADALLSNKETINKRLFRAKQVLRDKNIQFELPDPTEIPHRLETVLKTIYLLFNEGYYSKSANTALRKELCLEAMRLTLQLIESKRTNKPEARALLALMCFHASRFEARVGSDNAMILYYDQDRSLWDEALILRGEQFLGQASEGSQLSTYHLQAAIAYWHTRNEEVLEKWENILQYYNLLLQLEYSPIAALNRTYALARARGKEAALAEAAKLNLKSNHLYHTLMAELYVGIEKAEARNQLGMALELVKSEADRQLLQKKLNALKP